MARAIGLKKLAGSLTFATLLSLGINLHSDKALAAVLSQIITLPSPETSNKSYFSTTFFQFNPLIGTLTSVDINFQGVAVNRSNLPLVVSFTASSPQGTEYFAPGPAIFEGSSTGFFSFPVYANSVSGGGGLIPFIGSGSALVISTIRDYGSTEFTLTFRNPIVVTYTYTPSVLGTPGPIAGSGLVPLFGLAGAYLFRRRRAA